MSNQDESFPLKKNKQKLSPKSLIIFSCILCFFLSPPLVMADTAADIDAEVEVALGRLHRSNSAAKNISEAAKAVLVFPSIIKGGLIIGGQYGKGSLQIDGKTTGYYETVSASYGLQIGAQTFGYAMYFMNDSALDYLRKSNGWEVGVGPSVVVVDEGMAKSYTSSTYKDDILVFFFNQKGLMAGVGIQGTKITPISPP